MRLFQLNLRRQCLLGLLAGLLSGAGAAHAQGFHVDFYPEWRQNPGGLNNDFELPPGLLTSGWTEVYRFNTGSPTTMSAGLPLPPGFDFRFQGQPVTAVRAFAYFFLVFDTAQTSVQYIPGGLPDPGAPDRVAFLGSNWGSLATSQSRILTKTFGVAPHRQFWVQWNNMKVATSPAWGVLPGYQSIVLEEGSDRIHFVAQRNFWWRPGTFLLNGGLQLNGTTAWPLDSMTVRNAFQNDPRPLDNLTFSFEVGARPAADAAMWALRAPAELLAPGASVAPVRGAVVNRGTQPLTGWRVAYRLDAGPVQQLLAVTAPLASGDTAAFDLPSSLLSLTPGEHRLRAWVLTTAAQPDPNPHNDTLGLTVQVVARAVERRVVQEIATSSSCPPCVIFDDSLRAVDRRSPPVQVDRVAYPMNFPGVGDPYYLPEFGVRALTNERNIRNIMLPPALAAPSMIANGATVMDPTSRFFSPPLPPYDSVLTSLSGKLAPLAITGTCRVRGDSIQGTITLDPLIALPGRTHTLLAVVTERRTTGNATTNGQTEFHNVAKKIVLNRGLTAPLVPGQPLTVPYAHFFGPGHTVEHFDSLEVVAFVQYTALMGTGAPAEVVQVARLRPGTVLETANSSPAPLAWTLAPNPAAAGQTTLRLMMAQPAVVALAVRDALGRAVLDRPTQALTAGAHALPLTLNHVAPGVYSVQLTVDGRPTPARRLVVVAP